MTTIALACLLNLGAPALELKVDWKHPVGQTTHRSFGLNLFKAHDPALTSSRTYQAGLRLMNPGFVRIHSWESMGDSKTTPQGWIDHKAKDWDEEKILAALKPLSWIKGDVMVNIPSWPSWIGPSHTELPNPSSFAKWCGRLASILRKSKLKVTHLEITNEKDMPFFVDFRTEGGRGPLKDPAKPGDAEALGSLYTAAAQEVRRADPALKLGGPAAARPDLPAFADLFLKNSLPQLDFYSAHVYASGSKDDTLEFVLGRTQAMIEESGKNRRHVQAQARRPLPYSLNEFNISWTWETQDPRMKNHISAVFDALVLFGLAEQGIESAAAWNEMDGVYGKLDHEGNPRPAAFLYGALNRHGVGALYRAASTNPQVKAWGTKSRHGRWLWIVNTSEQALPLGSMKGSAFHVISEEGVLAGDKRDSLPPLSVAWLRLGS